MGVILDFLNEMTTKEFEKWESCIAESENATIYHTPQWCKTIKDYYGHDVLVLHDEKFNFIFPLVHINSRLFGNYLVSMPYAEYGGPVIKSSAHPLGSNIFDILDDYAGKNGIEYLEIRLPSDSKTKLPEGFKKGGSHATFLLDLSVGEKRIWNSFEKSVRNAVRKAEKSNLKVREVQSLEEIKDCYTLHLKTMRRLGTPPHSRDFFENLWKTLNKKNQIKIVAAEHDGEKIAAIITLPFKNRIIHWSSISEHKHRALNANSLLIWKAIKWGIENKFRLFDFGQTSLGSGVYHFKKAWSGKEIAIPRMIKFYRNASVYNLDSRKYQIATKLWSYLPLRLTEFLGSRIRKNYA